MKQLSGEDAAFVYAETARTPMHIGALCIYAASTPLVESTRFRVIQQLISARLHLARTFRQRLVRVPLNLDHPWWIEDAKFDLRHHVRHLRLASPGDWRQLCLQTAELHAQPLDLNRPPWEMIVIDGLEGIDGLPKGAFAILSKIHHACIDGISGAEITTVLHATSPYVTMPLPKIPWQGEPVPSALELAQRAHLSLLLQPLRYGAVFAGAMAAMLRVRPDVSDRQRSSAQPVPVTRFNRAITADRVFGRCSLPLSDVQQILTRVEGVTINDALLSVCGGALRRYLALKNELPEPSLTAMVPISVRRRNEDKALGNRVAAMTVALGTDIADPLNRLKAVNKFAGQSKLAVKRWGADWLLALAELVPATLAASAVRLYTRARFGLRVPPLFNCVITNVPGPQVPLYLGEAQLVAEYGLGPIVDGVGLFLAIFSYCGRVNISVISCRAMLPDPELLVQCLQQSFDELHAVSQGLSPSDSPVDPFHAGGLEAGDEK